jgi:alkylation response protein AidB-like acyl-CoA dehydrogenase
VPRSGAGSLKPSPTIHILIDSESIQPRHLETRADEDTHVTVFVGAHQERLPFDLVAAMQALGSRARYVKIARAGKNALDFHLAFYLGELAARDPTAAFRVMSRDGGFDALIAHLQARGLRVERLRLEPTSAGNVHDNEGTPAPCDTAAL